MNEWLLYYRSRLTKRRLLFRKSEIDRVERDGWYAKVILKSGAVFKVQEYEPETVLPDNAKPADKPVEQADPDILELAKAFK